MSNRYSYTEEYQRLPVGLRVVFYDAERRIHQYRDQNGQLWESDAGNQYGVLHRVDDTPAYFRSARHLSPLASASTTGTPMTEFPDTWDPPANHEVEDLPSGKRIAAKLGNYRRQMFGGRSRNSSGASQDSASAKSDRSYTPPMQQLAWRGSTDSFGSLATKSSVSSSNTLLKTRRF